MPEDPVAATDDDGRRSDGGDVWSFLFGVARWSHFHIRSFTSSFECFRLATAKLIRDVDVWC